MVRLVFRPYTQIRRTICTSVSLRASTRVSPGFALFRHRSPSFGSQQICSYSNLAQVLDRSIVPLAPRCQVPTSTFQERFTFIAHKGFQAQILAYMLDSLVRVSRRVNENHFVRISSAAADSSFVVRTSGNAQLCCPISLCPQTQGTAIRTQMVPQSNPRQDYDTKQTNYIAAEVLPLSQLSPADQIDSDSAYALLQPRFYAAETRLWALATTTLE